MLSMVPLLVSASDRWMYYGTLVLYAQKEVDGCLFVGVCHHLHARSEMPRLAIEGRRHTKQGVSIEAPDVLDDIPRMAIPVRHPTIGLNSVHQGATSVLQCDS